MAVSCIFHPSNLKNLVSLQIWATALHNEIFDTVVGMDPRDTEAIHEKHI